MIALDINKIIVASVGMPWITSALSLLWLAAGVCRGPKNHCEAYDYKKIFMEPAQLESFLEVPADSDFSLLNIPFGVFSKKEGHHQHPATRIGTCGFLFRRLGYRFA